ncbi:hypothetical protein [Streptococcus agalactiae]|uniref:hypothetical protein n=1 Tax=Streptococcus agalactiae TaxID=1311 RepID=UPI0018674BD3|nr:hypothetical protein [Streptococcus agalactiae]MBE3600771.1 hypothetical protein [Streptococcus agalactiae]
MTNNNTMFDRPIMTLSDLRRLGRQGGANLILDDGRQAVIRPRFAAEKKRQWKNGQWSNQEEILSFHEIYPAIAIVKRKHLIIAEKIKRNGKSLLVLTGVGYHRPNQNQRRKT